MPSEHVEPLKERAEALRGLLAAYGNVQNQPTERELWAGCKDAARMIEELLAELESYRIRGAVHAFKECDHAE